jgi:tetraacyldisaccharide 4'-kinase
MLPPRPLKAWWANISSSSFSWAPWWQTRVHAVAGIASPERFFKGLEAQGLEIIRHPFADHTAYRQEDLIFSEPVPVLMTEKDAVKCGDYNLDDHWVVPLRAELSAAAAQWLLQSLEAVNGRKTS